MTSIYSVQYFVAMFIFLCLSPSGRALLTELQVLVSLTFSCNRKTAQFTQLIRVNFSSRHKVPPGPFQCHEITTLEKVDTGNASVVMRS